MEHFTGVEDGVWVDGRELGPRGEKRDDLETLVEDVDIGGLAKVFQDLDDDCTVEVIEKLDEVMGDLETLCGGWEERGYI